VSCARRRFVMSTTDCSLDQYTPEFSRRSSFLVVPASFATKRIGADKVPPFVLNAMMPPNTKLVCCCAAVSVRIDVVMGCRASHARAEVGIPMEAARGARRLVSAQQQRRVIFLTLDVAKGSLHACATVRSE